MRTAAPSAALFALALAACTQTVPAPTADPSPPTLRWRIENLSNGSDVTIRGSGTAAAQRGQNLRVTLIADDPEGVRRIELAGGFATDCRFAGAGAAASGVYPLQRQVLAPDARNMVLPSIFLQKEVAAPSECPPGGEFLSARVTLRGTGENFFLGRAQETLEIQVSP